MDKRKGRRSHGRRGSPRGSWAAVALGLLVLGPAGCTGVMLDGRIYALDEAVVLPMKIETSGGHGRILASHPTTGEQFDGTYTAVRTGVAGSVIGGGPRGVVGGGGFVGPIEVPAIATLIGDQGTAPVLGSTLVSETVEVARSLVLQCLTPYEIVVCERPPLEFTLEENPHSTERDSRFFPPLRSAASMSTSGTSLATGDTRFYLPPL